MLQRLGAYLAGRVSFDILGGQGERFLNACAQMEIPLAQVVPTETGFCAQVPMRMYPRLHQAARRYRCRLRMREKRGAYVALWMYRKRWGILVGAALAVLLLFMCTRLVWTVKFYNIAPQQQAMLRAQLYEKGICEGSVVTTAQLKQAQNELFIENTAYGWVKLNFVGGRIVVEKGDAQQPAPLMPQSGACDVVALCDGQIEHMEVSAGYRVRTEGQYVSKGEVLVAGNYYSKRGTLFTAHAQAKVYARVQRVYEVRQPLQAAVQTPQGDETVARVLWFAGRHFALGRQPAPVAGVRQTVVKYPLLLFGLPLPATVEETRTRPVQEQTRSLTVQQATDIARVRAYDCMRAELPELALLAQTETVREEPDAVVLRLAVEGRANIAQQAPAAPAAPPEA